MSLMLIAVVQAAALRAPERVVPADFDLADVRRADEPRLLFDPSRGCTRRTPDEILVCGRRPADDYPIEEMARLFTPRRIVAETPLFGGAVTGRAYVESAPGDRGAVSNRVMIGITLPF